MGHFQLDYSRFLTTKGQIVWGMASDRRLLAQQDEYFAQQTDEFVHRYAGKAQQKASAAAGSTRTVAPLMVSLPKYVGEKVAATVGIAIVTLLLWSAFGMHWQF